MPIDLTSKGIGSEPVVATWELWSVATMLIAAHGDGAEAHVMERLQAAEHEGAAIVWRGVLTQLEVIRSEELAK